MRQSAIDTEEIRKKIEEEKADMERDIEKVQNCTPPKPKKSKVSENIAIALKLFGISILVGLVLGLILLAIGASIEAVSTIMAIPITLVLGFDVLMLIAIPYDERKELEKWKEETSKSHKNAEIEKIKRKYETRIRNLERHGTISNNSVFYPDEVCLECGSKNLDISPLMYPTYSPLSRLERRIVICKDCKHLEYYSQR